MKFPKFLENIYKAKKFNISKHLGFWKKINECCFCIFRDIFTVKDKPSASNVAYTSGYLAMHTDQPYNYYQPGVRFLSHSIASGSLNPSGLKSIGVTTP